MSSAILPVIIVVALVAVVWIGARSWGRRTLRTSDRLADPAEPTLDYRVPDQQDPVVVSAALRSEGFTATSDAAEARLLHVACRAGADGERDRVRSVILSARTTSLDSGQAFDPGEVRFTDER